jgi:hypothetical protein
MGDVGFLDFTYPLGKRNLFMEVDVDITRRHCPQCGE